MRKTKLFASKRDSNSLALIAGNMAALYESGISFLLIMDLLIELPVKKCYKESLYKIKEEIKSGKTLEDAFSIYKDLYPEFFIGMISLGEKSGNLNRVLKGIERYYKKINYIRETILNALSYPIILLASIIILILLIFSIIVPNLYSFFIDLDMEVPLIFRIANELSKFGKESPLLLLIYIIFWGILLPYFTLKGFFNKYIKRFFVKFKVIRDFYELIFLLIVTIIIQSGVSLTKGLIFTSNSFKSSILKEKLINLHNSLIQGKSISESLEKSKEYSNYTISIIKLGEESGSIEDRLDILTEYLESKVIKNINKYLTLLQPGMIIFMGGMVMVFIIIFVLPIFDLLSGSAIR
ncbi:type II secretion system F family protein [Caproiciproducens sp. MSJ-32]|uniref:type II secretion system F family protein n=1 Tax=Caproiciproducens sp. MSJ-32 TaxID=2841527 RepID=UPI001C115C79|nr:type II secretion system F family protein [Caproiciproducens sp. MSJ-32]MBU5454594.1 type II secretion system F family protein [Caproiciproducens sp. MSJ-32]